MPFKFEYNSKFDNILVKHLNLVFSQLNNPNTLSIYQTFNKKVPYIVKTEW